MCYIYCIEFPITTLINDKYFPDILARKKLAAEQAADKLNMDSREDLTMRAHARESSRSTIEVWSFLELI